MIQQINQDNEAVTPVSREMKGLREFFPQCFNAQGEFDIDKFREAIEPQVDVTREGRSYDFLGKSYARMLSSLDTTTVIRPDVEHNSKPENQDSENIYISGDNLDALHHLVKSYAGQVKCIYIDPPYNTGTDGFVYNDKFKFTAEELTQKLSISPDEAEKIIAMTSGHRASHAAWLTFMMPRLQLARDLLSKDGVIFISIDDNEQAYLKQLCDNVFGEDCFISSFIWKKRQMVDSRTKNGASMDHDFLLCYGRREDAQIKGQLSDISKYSNPDNDPRGDWMSADMSGLATESQRPNLHYDIIDPNTGIVYKKPATGWRYSKEHMAQLIADNEVIFPTTPNGRPRRKKFLKDVQSSFTGFSSIINTVYSTQGTRELRELFDGNDYFDFPKPVDYIKQIIEQGIDPCNDEDIYVLDFFSGSGTTAQAVMDLKDERLHFIMVQWKEKYAEQSEAYKAGYRTIDQIGMERIKRAAKKIQEENPLFAGDLGFKHYTLEEVPENTLDKLETFDPNVLLTTDDTLNLFGRDTVLTTWLVQDGYGLNAKIQDVKLDKYHATLCGNHLYMTDSGFTEDDMVALMDLYQKEPSFCPDCIVLFGYSFSHNAKDMLEKNKPTVDLVKDIKLIIDVRY
ncbi:MAG: site-specific DNA-methyltransferase [Bacteroidaceae bacterium]|nr:site-specific DNA-methyltransferase [Bacteroidaceae bacterium]